MVSPPLTADDTMATPKRWVPRTPTIPQAVTGVLFVLLFWQTFGDLASQWWNNPDAGHGLLLAPVCLFLAYRRGAVVDGSPNYLAGCLILAAAVVIRLAGTLAGELFTMRISMVVAMVGLIVCWRGLKQAVWWWLPLTVGALAVPLPAVIMNLLAIPLQLVATKIGAGLLEWRQVPFRLNGNVIDIPGFRLFVAEACSGLRSLTALLSLGVLIGGLWLQRWPTRLLLIALTIPVAIVLNGFRVFLTAFLMFFVSPDFGRGFMHVSEGWLIFMVALGIISLVGAGLGRLESAIVGGR